MHKWNLSSLKETQLPVHERLKHQRPKFSLPRPGGKLFSFSLLSTYYVLIDCCSKFANELKCSNRHRSKSIWVTSLVFCQNDSLMGESFWQKNRLVTHILFDLCLFEHFSPVANFEQQSIIEKTLKNLWVKRRTCEVLPVDRIKLNICKFWLLVFDLFEMMFSYTLVINQFKLRL